MGIVTPARSGRAFENSSSSRKAAAVSASAARRLCRLNAAISSPLACGMMSPASICAASAQLTRTKSTSDRRVTSGRSSRETKLPKKTTRSTSSGDWSASRAVTADEHEHANIETGPPPTARMTASSTRVSRSTDAELGQAAIGEPRADPVVAHDRVRPRELLVEATGERIVPLLLEVRHPLRAEDDRRAGADGRVRDARTTRELAEPDVLIHDPQCPWPERAMSTRWPVTGKFRATPCVYARHMQSRYLNGLTIRALRDGDTETVAALFARLGERSRERRFCGAKPRLSDVELATLARVDRDRHVLVGYVDGDSEPAGIARLVRDGDSAEIAFAVADAHQSRGIGSVLAGELAADARAAGITQLTATVCGDNPRVIALLERLGSLDMSWHGGERELVVGL